MIEATKLFNRMGLTSALALLCAAPLLAQDEAPESAADVLTIPDNVQILGAAEPTRRATAIVNGAIITGTDVDQRVALTLSVNDQGQPTAEQLARLRVEILRTLIDEALQIEEAKRAEIAVSPEEVADSYRRIAQDRFQRTPEQMDAWLEQVGSSGQSLRRQIEGELSWNRLLRRNVAPFVNVSAGEVTELHDRLQASKGTDEYRLAEIFLPSTAATREATVATAQQIVEQLRQGASFATAARQYSKASTAAVNGDLGWIRLEQLQNPQLQQITQTMQAGQLAGPVEIPGGLWIGYLIDRRQVGMADPRDAILSLKQIALDFAPGTSQEDARTRATAFSEAAQQIRGCGEADGVAAQIGAQVVDNDQIRVRDLPEALQPILLELNVGQATPPFGSLDEGVRVLMVCGREDPQDTGGPSYEQLMSQLEDDRIGKRAQRYLRDLRRDAVIEYN